MIAITISGFLAVINLATGSSDVQTPTLTPCAGVSGPTVVIQSITIKNAKLGSLVMIDAEFEIKATLDSNPTLYLSFYRPNGTQLGCPDYISNCKLKLCNGTKITEKMLNMEWKNKCPIRPGTYTAHLIMLVLNDENAKNFIGDGNVVVKFLIKNGGRTAECVTFTVYVKQ